MNFTESAVEAAAIEWFADLGYATASGPDLLPNSGTPERASASEVVLRGRLREALARINAGLPQNAIDEALRKIETNDAVLLVDRNHRMHDALVNGIDVEYQKGDGTDAAALCSYAESRAFGVCYATRIIKPASARLLVDAQLSTRSRNRGTFSCDVRAVSGCAPLQILRVRNSHKPLATVMY